MIAILGAVLFGAVELQPCDVQGQKAECGAIPVWENRRKQQGRRIDLSVAVIRRAPGKQSTDPIFILAGGPGLGATMMTSFVARFFDGADRDIVLVDVRGTGRSNPLRCELGGSDEDIPGYFNDFLPIEPVAACKQTLAARADLTQYTTRAAVDDLEEVRKKLGYQTINLYGSSYGTRLAQEFMRHHPDSVRMAILHGVASPSLVAPATYARDAQRSLEGVFALCAEDAACSEAYPGLRADYEAMLTRIANGIETTVQDPKTKLQVRLKIHRGLFGEVFRNFLYSPEMYALMPSIVHRAARGDFEQFGQTALDYGRAIRGLDFGFFLSVTCAEDIARLDPAAAMNAAEGTLLGVYRVDQQVAACRIWPHGVADPVRTAPLASSIPTLLLSGELDPVTPPKYAHEVAQTLSEVVHVVVPKGGHSGDTGGCLEKIAVDAVKAGSVRKLDLACLRTIPSPWFFIGDEQAGAGNQRGGAGFRVSADQSRLPDQMSAGRAIDDATHTAEHPRAGSPIDISARRAQ